MVVARFLSCVDERLALRQGECQHRHQLRGLSHPLILASGPAVLVVVGREHQTESLAGEFFRVFFHQSLEFRSSCLTLGNRVEQVMALPGVACVKADLVQPRLLALRKEIQGPVVFASQCRNGLGPEVLRHYECHIAAESIDAAVKPEAHRIAHGIAYVRIVVV